MVGVQSLPSIVLLSKDTRVSGREGRRIKMDDEDRMRNLRDLKATDILDFVITRTGLTATVEFPSIVKTWWFPFAFVAVCWLVVGFLYKAYHSCIYNYKPSYAIAALAIYAYSVGGGLYTVIRGIPFAGLSPGTGKPEYYSRGTQMQWGAEGLIMSSSYLLFSIPLLLMYLYGDRVKNPVVQKVLAYGILGLAFLNLTMAFSSLSWKTGYKVRSFVPWVGNLLLFLGFPIQ